MKLLSSKPILVKFLLDSPTKVKVLTGTEIPLNHRLDITKTQAPPGNC